MAPRHSFFVCCLLALPSVLGQFHVFKTEPTHRSPILNFTQYPPDPSVLHDGFIFMAPFTVADTDHFGPIIYDKKGDVVWNGIATVSSDRRIGSFHTCDYLGTQSKHLCWSEANVKGYLHEQGSQVISNNNYQQDGTPFGKAESNANMVIDAPNDRELNVMEDGKTFLQVVYNMTVMDLTPYDGPEDGIVYDGCFQEIDIETRAPLFTWCASNYLPVWQTYMYLDIETQHNFSEPGGGNGMHFYPWDPFHINAVDKNEAGDYIISLRHFNQILKISGTNGSEHEPGTILWRLGGKYATIRMDGDAAFDTQHMVRFIESNQDGDTISLFNNGYQLVPDAPDVASKGLIMHVNNNTNMSALLNEYPNPAGRMSQIQGSMSVLPNGNAFVGWGSISQFTEFAEDGTVLLDGAWGEIGTHLNYRTYSETWEGEPQDPPKLVVYTKTCSSSPVTAYVSWNGATHVAEWRIKTSITEKGPWITAGTVSKKGFETAINLKAKWVADTVQTILGFIPYVQVEALDSSGNTLASVQAETFVPHDDLVTPGECDDDGCKVPEFFEYKSDLSAARSCPRSTSGSVTILVVVLLLIGLLGYLLKVAVVSAVNRRRNAPGYDKVATEAYEDEEHEMQENVGK